MKFTKNINTSFILTIILRLQEIKSEYSKQLISQIENLKYILKKVENNDFDIVFAEFINSYMQIIETILVNELNPFDFIDFDNKPAIKLFSLKNRRLKHLYNQITDYVYDAFKQFKTKNFSELLQSNPDELDEYAENALKFSFFFIVADLFLNKEIKLNKKRQKILYNELKQNFEIYFAVLKLLNFYQIDEKSSNQFDRNILITSRIIALKHNLTNSVKIKNTNEILNLV